MIKTSEWVSLGHPDKMADFVSSYLLDRHLEIDPATRYAVEVQIKDNHVTLGGEVTSKAVFSEKRIADFVREAVNEIGYTSDYQDFWGRKNTISSEELSVVQYIGKQSPDIAQGVDNSGWGDQGIFWGMAVNSPNTDFMPVDWFLARKIGKALYDRRVAGLDIKTQVTLIDDKVDEVVVAIPMNGHHRVENVRDIVTECCGGEIENLSINGTGKYEKHGPVGDCGTTGRKLAVDLYGGNCRIGGGCPWTKDGSKADLTLNIHARKLALAYLHEHPNLTEVHCAISCRIGSPKITVTYFDGNMNELCSCKGNVPPSELIAKYGLDRPVYAKLCREGLFSCLR